MSSRAAMSALTLLLVACGASPPTTSPRSSRTGPDDLGALAWLAGTWRGEGDDASHEAWMVGRDGAMVGFGWSGAGEHHELLRIESDADGTRYLASPSDQATTPFALTSVGPERAVFENPRHDFPKRIEYVRLGDRLSARISGGPDQREARFAFRREAGPPEPTPLPGTACIEEGELLITLEPCWCGERAFCAVGPASGEAVDVTPIVVRGSECDACTALTVRCALPPGATRVTAFGQPLASTDACGASPSILLLGFRP